MFHKLKCLLNMFLKIQRCIYLVVSNAVYIADHIENKKIGITELMSASMLLWIGQMKYVSSSCLCIDTNSTF